MALADEASADQEACCYRRRLTATDPTITALKADYKERCEARSHLSKVHLKLGGPADGSQARPKGDWESTKHLVPRQARR